MEPSPAGPPDASTHSDDPGAEVHLPKTGRQLIMVIASVAMLAGCFLPWAEVAGRTVETADVDRWFFIGLAVLIAGIQFDEHERGFALVLIGLGALALTGFEYGAVDDVTDVSGLPGGFGPSPEPGLGLWVLLGSSLVVVATALAMLRIEHQHEEPPRSSTD